MRSRPPLSPDLAPTPDSHSYVLLARCRPESIVDVNYSAHGTKLPISFTVGFVVFDPIPFIFLHVMDAWITFLFGMPL